MQFIQDNIWIALVAASSGLMLVWSLVGNSVRGIKEITTAAAVQLINYKDALVLDVREAAEFHAGHVLNAKHIPLGNLNGRIAELEPFRANPIVVMSSGNQGSAAACALLGKHGFESSCSLAGGVLAWRKAELPLVT